MRISVFNGFHVLICLTSRYLLPGPIQDLLYQFTPESCSNLVSQNPGVGNRSFSQELLGIYYRNSCHIVGTWSCLEQDMSRFSLKMSFQSQYSDKTTSTQIIQSTEIDNREGMTNKSTFKAGERRNQKVREGIRNECNYQNE